MRGGGLLNRTQVIRNREPKSLETRHDSYMQLPTGHKVNFM